MAISYKEACTKAGLDTFEQVQEKIKYVAYKNGSANHFDDKKEALACSTLVERLVTNEDDVRKNREELRRLNRAAFDIWYESLREEYSYFSDAVFNLVYDMANERGHSSGYDEVANCMIDVAVFAEKIIAATKKGQ